MTVDHILLLYVYKPSTLSSVYASLTDNLVRLSYKYHSCPELKNYVGLHVKWPLYLPHLIITGIREKFFVKFQIKIFLKFQIKISRKFFRWE